MKVKELVELLYRLGGDETDVCIGDVYKWTISEDENAGIFPEFKVDFIDEEPNKPFICLTFKSEPLPLDEFLPPISDFGNPMGGFAEY